jgi:hypothetical protein
MIIQALFERPVVDLLVKGSVKSSKLFALSGQSYNSDIPDNLFSVAVTMDGEGWFKIMHIQDGLGFSDYPTVLP